MNLRTIEERLRKEHGLQDDFVFWRWEAFPKRPLQPMCYVELTGGRCPLVTRGKRRGKPNYRKAIEKQTFVVTVEQAERWESEYEENTGNCRECRGRGKTVYKMDFVNGTKEYRDCRKCSGSGKRKND